MLKTPYAPHFENAPAFDLAYAWTWAAELIDFLAIAFGDPKAILERLHVRRSWRRALAARLRPIEAYVRRLLLIEACMRPAPEPPPTPDAKRPADAARLAALPRKRTLFAILPQTARAKARNARRSRESGDPFVPARGSAMRLNALAHVIANPEPAMRRLMKRLHQAEPRIAALLDRRPPGILPPHDQFFDEAEAEANRLLARRDYFESG